MDKTTKIIDVQNCARCQQNHKIEFKALENPNDDWAWWGMCPNVDQPIMMQIVSEKPATAVEKKPNPLLPPLDMASYQAPNVEWFSAAELAKEAKDKSSR